MKASHRVVIFNVLAPHQPRLPMAVPPLPHRPQLHISSRVPSTSVTWQCHVCLSCPWHDPRKRMLLASCVAPAESHPLWQRAHHLTAAEATVTFVDALSPVPRQGIRAARTNPRLKTTVPARVTDRIKHGLDSWEVQEGFMAQYKEMQILLSFKPFLCYHRFFFFPSLGVRLNSAFRVRKLTQSAAATWPRLLCFPVGACGSRMPHRVPLSSELCSGETVPASLWARGPFREGNSPRVPGDSPSFHTKSPVCEDTSQTWVHWDDTEKGMGAWACLLAWPNT